MRETLENGMTVVLHENRAAKVAALQLWVDVGSADELPGEEGLAHVHEHMLFKGTGRRGPGEIARTVESSGGEINAWTSFDQTVYHLVVPAESFEEGLDILADAVTDSLFDPDELARETEVVLEEIRRSDDSPNRRVSRALFGLAYERHPYSRPVIGYEDVVRSFTRDGILDFYTRHYVAPNMTFVGVGCFDETEALAAIRRAFSKARAGPAGKRQTREKEPVQKASRARIIHAPTHESYLSIGWPGPEVHSKDVAALDLLAVLLGQGDASRLVQELKRERSLVNAIYASAYTPRDPGLFVIGAGLKSEHVQEAARNILRQVLRVRHEDFTGEELSRAKRLLESETLYQRETVEGQARKLGFFETTLGHVDEEERYLAAVANATPSDLREAAHRWLSPDRLNVVVLGPEEKLLAANVTEETLVALVKEAAAHTAPVLTHPPVAYSRLAHASFAPRRRTKPGIHVEKLDNGVTLVVHEDSAVPLFSMRAAWVGGLRAETPDDNGIHFLTSRMLLRGTTNRDAKTLAREIDELAAGLGGSPGRNSFGVRGEFLAADLDRAFDLFSDVMFNPLLDEGELEKEKALVVEQIRARDDSPAAATFSLFANALYQAHPYRLDLYGSEKSVQSLNAENVRRLMADRYSTDGLVLSVVGDVSTVRVRDLVTRFFREAKKPRRPLDVPRDPPLVEAQDVSRVLDRRQAHLIVGFRGTTLNAPDRWALDVLGAVLSGQGGRLFMDLRDKRSLAYSVSSIASEGLDPGYFGVYIGTSPEKVTEAKAGIRDHLERVRNERIGDDELGRAARYLVGTHEIGLQRTGGRAAMMALNEAYGLGAAHHLGFAERIKAVTADDILAVARRVIDFDRSVTALVTPAT